MKRKIQLLSLFAAIALTLGSCGANDISGNDSISETQSVSAELESVELASTKLEGSEPAGVNANIENLDTTIITMNAGSISVDNAEISTNESERVYLAKKTETHPDVTKTVENSVITITEPGTYEFSGSAEDTQILVDIDEENSEQTRLILNNLDIKCYTAPAILIASAYETDEEGTGSVAIELAENSSNTVTGSHTVKDEANGITKKNDAAISSNVSMILEGTGKLVVDADNEGIETKMHITINGGDIVINAHDDALNASEDGVSHIIINSGSIIANSTFGKEGDGIDSNGYMTINGGNVYAYANETSMDSGFDSDLGITINGGTVIASGNMYDEIKLSDTQEFVFLNLAQTNSERITMLDENEKLVFSFMPTYSFSTLCFSSPELQKAGYTFYLGGSVEGEENNGLTTEATSFVLGEQVQGSAGQSRRGPGGAGGPGGERPEGPGASDENNANRPAMAEGETPPEMPEGGFDPQNRPQMSQDASDLLLTKIFDLNDGNMFSNISKIIE